MGRCIFVVSRVCVTLIMWTFAARAQFSQHMRSPMGRTSRRWSNQPLTSVQTSIQTMEQRPSRTIFVSPQSFSRMSTATWSSSGSPTVPRRGRARSSRRIFSMRRPSSQQQGTVAFGGGQAFGREVAAPPQMTWQLVNTPRDTVVRRRQVPVIQNQDYVHIDEVVALASQLMGMGHNLGELSQLHTQPVQTMPVGAATRQTQTASVVKAVAPPQPVAVAPAVQQPAPVVVAAQANTVSVVSAAPAAAVKAAPAKPKPVSTVKAVPAAAAPVFGTLLQSNLGPGLSMLGNPTSAAGIDPLMTNLLLSSDSGKLSSEQQLAMASGFDLALVSNEEMLRKELARSFPREKISTGNARQDRLVARLMEDRRQNLIEDTAESIRKRLLR